MEDVEIEMEMVNYYLAMKNQERSATNKILVLEIIDKLIMDIWGQGGANSKDPLTLKKSKIEEIRGGRDPVMGETTLPTKKSTAPKNQLSKTPIDRKIRLKDSLRNRGGVKKSSAKKEQLSKTPSDKENRLEDDLNRGGGDPDMDEAPPKIHKSKENTRRPPWPIPPPKNPIPVLKKYWASRVILDRQV